MAAKKKPNAVPATDLEYAERAYIQIEKDLELARIDRSHQAVSALHRRQEEAWRMLQEARAAAPTDPFAGLSPEEIEGRLTDEARAMPLEHLAVLARVYKERCA